jgi:uncharacterized protein YdaU (DUF1376 family)
VHYYEHHIGDYDASTAHLSLVEDAIYSRMIRRYYRQEGPLPVAVEAVARLIRATDQLETVKTILLEFFTLSDDGWHKDRCDDAIAKYRERCGKARVSAQLSVQARQRQKTGAELRSERMTVARQKGKHTKAEWESLREFCGYRCVKCGAEGRQDRDHIVPVYQGGSDGIDNIQPLCARCNAGKGPESVDYRPGGWQAFVERSLSVGSTNQEPITNNQKPKDKTKGGQLELPEWLSSEAWSDWHKYRNSRKGWTPKARELSLRTLTELWATGHDPRAVIHQSIERGWTGLFPVKAGTGPPSAAKPSAAADFRGKTYESTAIENLPADLRAAAERAMRDD